MKKFVVSFLFLVVSLVGCREHDVPVPVGSDLGVAAEGGVDILIFDDFARVPFDSVVVGDVGLPLETHDGDPKGTSKGILRLKRIDRERLPGDGSGLVAGDPFLPVGTFDDGGKSKGILRLKHLLQERLPGVGEPGVVFWDGVGIEDKR